MKRILVLVISLCSLVSMTACASSDNDVVDTASWFFLTTKKSSLYVTNQKGGFSYDISNSPSEEEMKKMTQFVRTDEASGVSWPEISDSTATDRLKKGKLSHEWIERLKPLFTREMVELYKTTTVVNPACSIKDGAFLILLRNNISSEERIPGFLCWDHPEQVTDSKTKAMITTLQQLESDLLEAQR